MTKPPPTSENHSPSASRPDYNIEMSLLRPSIAGRLLRAGAPASQKLGLGARRWDSQNATLLQSGESQANLVNHEASNDTQVRHNQPDYTADVDQASS